MKNNKAKKVDLIKEVLNNDRKIYLYSLLELAPERLHVERYRIVLGKFVKAVWSIDLKAVIV